MSARSRSDPGSTTSMRMPTPASLLPRTVPCMAFVDTPLPPRAQIEETWDIALAGEPRRLHGGEESAAYALGDVVVRVSPGWRSLDELDWCYRVAAAAKVHVPEVVAPIVAA